VTIVNPFTIGAMTEKRGKRVKVEVSSSDDWLKFGDKRRLTQVTCADEATETNKEQRTDDRKKKETGGGGQQNR